MAEATEVARRQTSHRRGTTTPVNKRPHVDWTWGTAPFTALLPPDTHAPV